MHKEETIKASQWVKQRYFAARELHFSIAMIVVLSLIGGIGLQTVSSALVSYYHFNMVFVGMLLIFGYAGLVVLVSIFFAYRLIGPFRRLEYELKLISSGDLSKRLSIRSKDDLHIRNFTKYANNLIAKFEVMSRDYNTLSSAVSREIDDIHKELEKRDFDCEILKKRLITLQKNVRDFRVHW
ncbi:MAG: hypothetical protein AAB356_02925 [Deltaproteobacteria bacterium]